MPQQQSLARFFSASGNLPKTKPSVDKADISELDKPSISEIKRKASSTIPENVEKKLKVEATEAVDSDPSEVSEEDTKAQELSDASKLIKLSEKEQEKHTCTEASSKIHYSELTELFEKIEQESSRLKITAFISQFYYQILEHATSDKLVKIIYLCINRLGPDYEPDLELGLGETLLIKAISECYGRPPSKIKKDYQEVGDLGIVAQKSRSGQPTMFKPTRLDIVTVFENLTKIAKSTGKDSQSKKNFNH